MLKMKKSYVKTLAFCQSLIVLCFFISSTQQSVHVLDLEEGDICRKSQGLHADYVCKNIESCEFVTDYNKTYNRLPDLTIDVCSYDVYGTIICCPPSTINETTIVPHNKTEPLRTADLKCREYSELAVKIDEQEAPTRGVNSHLGESVFFITGGSNANAREFPHMALLGYGDTDDFEQWRCGGTLISERWILTAAHCIQIPLLGLARRARLGDLNIASTYDDARPQNYRIEQHIKHPDYKPPSHYNDIALLRLKTDVEFSTYVIPICLNSDAAINPSVQIATGWGQIYTGGPKSTSLLKADLNIIPSKHCNTSYFAKDNPKLKFGIVPDMMVCAGSLVGGRDACGGDSGGPLQIKHFEYKRMYTQIAITSFGKLCGDKHSPGVYTRVSKYISWIENIVWPTSEIGSAN